MAALYIKFDDKSFDWKTSFLHSLDYECKLYKPAIKRLDYLFLVWLINNDKISELWIEEGGDIRVK